jgi:ferredoxin, 2Fe-2S
MQAAHDNAVPGFPGDCGGSCMCASCHGYVEHRWIGRLEPPSQNERDMLDTIDNSRSNSRLTCQILMSDELDGIVVSQPKPLV